MSFFASFGRNRLRWEVFFYLGVGAYSVTYFANAGEPGQVLRGGMSITTWALFYFTLLLLLCLVTSSLVPKLDFLRLIASAGKVAYLRLGKTLAIFYLGFLASWYFYYSQSFQPPSRFVFLPPYSTIDSRAIGVGAFLALLSLNDLLLMVGFPPGITVADHPYRLGAKAVLHNVFMAFLGCALTWSTAAFPAVHWFHPLAFLLAAFYLITGSSLITAYAARYTFMNFPVAVPTEPENGQPTFLHATDIHVVQPGVRSVEVGEGGNARLALLAKAAVRRGVQAVIVTGDITDHGLTKEWELAQASLAPLSEKGIPVYLVPGNHDLSVAYDPLRQFDAAFLHEFFNRDCHSEHGKAMREYLSAASRLAPLLARDGRPLSDVVVDLESGFEKIRTHYREFRASGSDSSLQEMTTEVIRLFPWLDEQANWRGVFLNQFEAEFESAFVPIVYSLRWYSHFPLYSPPGPLPFRVIILNSIMNESRVLSSAYGDFGSEQLDHLRRLIVESSGPVVILSHHAAFRWNDERSPVLNSDDLQRWACLSLSVKSAKSIEETLRSLSHPFVFLCGHRHGGKDRLSKTGTWAGGRVGEGASLADAGTKVIAGSWSSGGFRLFFSSPEEA